RSILTLRNAGVGTLDWSIPTPSITGAGLPVASRAPAVSASRAAAAPADLGTLVAGSGGPDAFGYRYIDSDQPGGPDFVWVDLNSSGHGIPIDGLQTDDQISDALPLGFTFPFYGQSFTSVRVSTNGFLTFTGTTA